MRFRIQDMNWQEFDVRRKEADTVIIPMGAIEIYGPHLPMASDIIVAENLAILVAEKTGALVAPSIPFGDSSMIMDFPGTITLRKSTLEAVVDDVCTCLIRYGFKNLMFINGHSGNIDTISTLARKYQNAYGVRCGQIDWWRFAIANSGGIFEEKGYMAHGHASECGTSVMLHLRPDLVDMSKATRVEPPAEFFEIFTDVIRYIPFSQKTANGTIGDAKIATAEKGEALIEKSVERIAAYMKYEFEREL